MSSTNYTRWWRDGSIAATKNSNEVVGTSTYWATTNINPGDIMKINGVDYEVQKVTDDTHITLATPYTGETGSGLAYAIVRNFTSTTNAKVAAQTSELMYDFAHFIDKERSTITGKSAYEIAKDNGYVGTEAQWLESLKAAGEWTQANTRLTALETDNTSNKSRLNTAEAKDTFKYPTKSQIIKHEDYRGIHGDQLNFDASTSAQTWATTPYLGDWVNYTDSETDLTYRFTCIDINRYRLRLDNAHSPDERNSWWMLTCKENSENNILRTSMCSTDNTSGGFAGSNVWSTKLDEVYNWIITRFPNLTNNTQNDGKYIYCIKKIPHSISNAVDENGKVTGMVNIHNFLQIPSAEEIFEAGRYLTGIPYFESTNLGGQIQVAQKTIIMFNNSK